MVQSTQIITATSVPHTILLGVFIELFGSLLSAGEEPIGGTSIIGLSTSPWSEPDVTLTRIFHELLSVTIEKNVVESGRFGVRCSL